ncbi:response regulator [Candidatus Saccharibacteria bacterium]|nr:response regulator [Candidatus Saccharibacteria bacterium]
MKRVLIVDDDKWFAESVGKSLKHKFRVATVGTAEAVFPAIEKFKPDFLLLDLVLGGKNAVTFLNEFISYDDLDGVKIVVMSSAAKDVLREDLLQIGVAEVLDKTEITPEALCQTLETLK